MNSTHFLLASPAPSLAAAPESAAVPKPTPRRGFKKRWILYGMLGVFGGIALALVLFVAWSLFPSGELRALQAALLPPEAPRPETHIAFRVGSVVLAPARWVASLVHPDPDLLDALGAVRHAEVSVREFSSASPLKFRQEGFEAIDRSMESRGWERIVGVKEVDQRVGIYVPRASRPDRQIDVCLFVCERNHLVIVSARCSTPHLASLVERHGTTRWHAR